MISVFVSGVWTSAKVLDDNPKTLWVTLAGGDIIKRHKVKHRMRDYIPPEPVVEEKPEEVLSWWRRLWNRLKGGVECSQCSE